MEEEDGREEKTRRLQVIMGERVGEIFYGTTQERREEQIKMIVLYGFSLLYNTRV